MDSASCASSFLQVLGHPERSLLGATIATDALTGYDLVTP